MNPLMDPNVAYLLLVLGLVLGILALFSPGTGLLEIGAVFAIVLAGIGALNLRINPWALGILIVGVVPFYFALRRSRHWIFLLVTIAAVIAGSVLLFETAEGKPAVNFWLALVTSSVVIPILWVVGRKGIEAMGRGKDIDLNRLIGAIGEAKTDIHKEGSVYIMGEEWSAWSDEAIQAGSKVRVIKREGLILQVEKVNEE
ncbi:MAG: NfeD family protein [Chloroflexota bacterium]